MILPPPSVAAGPATAITTNISAATPTSLPDYARENWSSLIGIITAIVGNILISFALNIQRYAHIRLEREWQEKEKQRKRRRISYNSRRSKSSEDRQKLHSNGGSGVAGEGFPATEADPLLPSGTRSVDAPTNNGRASRLSSVGPEGDAGAEIEEEAYKQTSYLKSPYWWTGIILMTTGEAGNFLAYGFAPASIVSPLGVVALVSNCMIAPFMLKERFRKRDGLGVLVAVAGAVTVVASASDNNPKLGPDEIWKLITTWEFETYLGITVAVIVALSFASDRFGDKSILIDLGLVGLYGGYTALSTKGVASMLSYTLWRAITFPVTYLLVATLIFTAIMQIKYINRALQRFDATQVIPVQFVLFTLSVILGSAILYRDFKRTSGDDAGKFVGGCAMTFLGVWLITSGRSRDRNEDEDREPEDEDAINLIEERYHDELDGVAEEEEEEEEEAEEDDGVVSTRRPSTVRATSPPINIRRRTSTYGTSQSSTPATPPPHTSNPWADDGRLADSPSTRRAPHLATRHSTLSAPLLPSDEVLSSNRQATISDPELAPSTNPALPHTPVRGSSENILNPVTPNTASTLPPRLRRLDTAERLSSSARTSIPGPLLASPLSNSLSAMVADLKRSNSLRGSPSTRDVSGDAVRRRESVLGIGAREVDEGAMGEVLERRRTATDDVPSLVGRGNRQRSLSGTLGELWRGIRGEGQGGGDEERGVDGGGV
ncbi:magnesium transporter NIPA-domain-containing protein [Dendryphion nanum]|uniref:Magnesium transporter NIPA-domain-containing protein n=1 Tax=Dendryphion nanum TaxID=256645 RepID=A0A9P9DQ42_9PLEO|nr:magnesium transporter NIPA-domain-containing protein [Dendryphion nanum]